MLIRLGKSVKFDMPTIDLDREFDRTGLPRSALAAFLGLDNATISRLADGRRSWKPSEREKAHSFFGVVPDGLGALVRRLRRREVRLLIGPILADGLVGAGHKVAFAISLRALSEGMLELRADQIVALCRKFDVDLAHLIAGQGMRKEPWPGDKLTLVNYENACWQSDVRARSSEGSDRSGKRSRRANTAQQDPSFRIALCEPLIVMDDELEPRYRCGETIYIDVSGRECRHGDDVVILLSEGDSVIGTLSANGPQKILLDTPKRGRVEIPAAGIVAMRRISFTER